MKKVTIEITPDQSLELADDISTIMATDLTLQSRWKNSTLRKLFKQLLSFNETNQKEREKRLRRNYQ